MNDPWGIWLSDDGVWDFTYFKLYSTSNRQPPQPSAARYATIEDLLDVVVNDQNGRIILHRRYTTWLKHWRAV